MKSKVLAALVATMAVGATCAFAANPFVDVPSDSWAYKSVVELADAGIIQGVDGEHFQGQRNITRYEAAEMVAKAMAHMDKASVEQRALINKLADEFADELNNLGVRVSALENRVGNVKLTGDARVRFIHQDADDNGEGKIKDDSSWSYRVRLRANAQVNDRTKVTYGISTGNHTFSQNGAAEDENDIYTDRANVEYQLGKDWTVMAGRYNYKMGGDNSYGFLYGDTFDGAQLQYKGDSFALTGGYGKFKESNLAGVAATDTSDGTEAVKTGYGLIEGFSGNGSAIGGYYNDFSAGDGFRFDDAWGAYASINLGTNWNALANYEKYNSESGNQDPEIWVGKLTYGAANFATPKSWDIWVEYLNADDGFDYTTSKNKQAFIGSTDSWRSDNLLNNVKSWGAGIDYTFAKNAQFQVMQSFASEAKSGSNDPGEETRAQFVFVF
ncbi:MAG: S-layer homology domain-containing protein [Megasphaera massiliensis]|uniref:S-layer homology domain-containing protein n=1 Tax=Megasphaera massiliensis TaxID=1232428 RepID=UPI00266BAEAF|nr:S-layer homology domain-containing protein [Megasphaera massiliensis]MEE0658185.1 S-layer homology domain-containing protein [Megasphaera massiliensis]